MGLREILGYGGRESDVASDILSEVDPAETSQKELVSTIDQKSESADVDPFAVAEEMAEENAEVDQKIFGRIRERIRQFIRDPDSFSDREQIRDALDGLEGVVDANTLDEAKRQVANGNVERARETILQDPGVLEELGISDMNEVGDVGLFADVDQNMAEENEDGDDGEDEENSKLDMLADDAQETVEDYAELVGKDPEECVHEVLGGDVGGVDQNKNYDQKSVVTHDELDQKLDEHTERVTEAITDDEVVGQIAQKMASDEDFQDEIVETVDQKGDFESTPSPNNDAVEGGKTVGDVMLGGDGGDN